MHERVGARAKARVRARARARARNRFWVCDEIAFDFVIFGFVMKCVTVLLRDMHEREREREREKIASRLMMKCVTVPLGVMHECVCVHNKHQSVCLFYVCIQIYIYICIRIYIYTHIYAYTYIYVYIYKFSSRRGYLLKIFKCVCVVACEFECSV